jgi:hypothetical protein
MSESIVVGTDGSESAGIAVERVIELARATALQLQAFSEQQPPRRNPSLPALLRWTQMGRDAGSPRAWSCVRTERDGRLRAAQIAAVREPQAPRGAQMSVATPAVAAGPGSA